MAPRLVKKGHEVTVFGIKTNEYFLYVSRLEPENNAHIVIKAFEKVKTNKKLIIVGDAPYARDYINSLKRTKDKRIIFTGFVFDPDCPKDLEVKIKRFIQDKNLAIHMRANVLEKAREFLPEKIISEYLKVYHEVLY